MSIERYRTQEIGRIDQGIDGVDQYLLVADLSDDIDTEVVEQEFLEHHYRDTNVAGGYFCHSVTVSELPSDNKCIVIIHHRYDV
jgi:hypothetical protein